MAVYLISRPSGAEHLRNPAAIHGALVEGADPAAAIAAANALTTGLNEPFTTAHTVTLIAATAAGSFQPALVEGEVVGDAYGKRRGK